MMDENYDEERATSVANLAEQARQLILQVKDLSNDILLETWEEFNEIFSDEFTIHGKEMVKNILIEQVESNMHLIARAKENLNEVAEFMSSKAALGKVRRVLKI